MNRQTQIQIACILSDIFLESALIYKDDGTINEDLTKAYYIRIANEILQIYPHFSKKDLDSNLFNRHKVFLCISLAKDFNI